MAPPTSFTASHPHPVQAQDSPKLGWSPQVRPHEEWRTLASPKGEPEPAPEKPPPAPAVGLALVLEEDDEEEEKPAVRKPHPPSHPPQTSGHPHAAPKVSVQAVVETVLDAGQAVQAKARKAIVEKRRKSGHSRDQTARAFESHARDGKVDRAAFAKVVTDVLRLGLSSEALDLLYTTLKPDGDDRVELASVLRVLHTKERWDPSAHFPQNRSVRVPASFLGATELIIGGVLSLGLHPLWASAAG